MFKSSKKNIISGIKGLEDPGDGVFVSVDNAVPQTDPKWARVHIPPDCSLILLLMSGAKKVNAHLFAAMENYKSRRDLGGEDNGKC